MERKKNGKWQMCTDFIDLNKRCPKDDLPLTRIDKIVDSTTASEMMALLDRFSEYHLIWLHTDDEEKNQFHHSVRNPPLPQNAGRAPQRKTYFL
jgi:hypothetical protein